MLSKIKNFNRLNDVFFKSLLGDDKRKQLTLNFLNSILNKDEHSYFTDIHYMDKEMDPITEVGKVSILDIMAEMNDKTMINIEVQVCKQNYISKPSLYYWSKMYGNQLKSGDNYTNLNKAIAINLLDFSHLPYNTYHNSYHIQNDITHDILVDDFEMHFIELNKFSFSDIKNIRKSDKWIAYFSNKCTDEQREVIAMSEPAIQKALEFENYFTQDELLRRQYDIQEKAIRDYNSGISSAIEQGQQAEKIQNAINGLKAGIDIDIISKITDLSIQEIKELQKTI